MVVVIRDLGFNKPSQRTSMNKVTEGLFFNELPSNMTYCHNINPSSPITCELFATVTDPNLSECVAILP